MPNDGRRCIVILGMHRSGTSAAAGTAVRLGAAAPNRPLDASDDNPAGFYESLAVVMQNHAMLLRAGCAWNLCLHRDAYEISETAPAFSTAFTRTLAEAFDDAPLYVLKDPRLCMTFPAWLPVIRGFGHTISVLMMLRHPMEVVRSLHRRNQLPETESLAQWLHHVLESEQVSRGLPRAVMFYDDLLSNWRLTMLWAGQRSGIGWPVRMQDAAPEVDRYLAPRLRHQRLDRHAAILGPAELVPLAQAAWEAMHALRENPEEPSRLRHLDSIRKAFSAWRQVHHPPNSVVHWPAAV